MSGRARPECLHFNAGTPADAGTRSGFLASVLLGQRPVYHHRARRDAQPHWEHVQHGDLFPSRLVQGRDDREGLQHRNREDVSVGGTRLEGGDVTDVAGARPASVRR